MSKLHRYRLYSSGPGVRLTHVPQLEIVDFGASRGYSETFANLYKNMLLAAQNGHRDLCESVSRELKFLTADDGPVSPSGFFFFIKSMSALYD